MTAPRQPFWKRLAAWTWYRLMPFLLFVALVWTGWHALQAGIRMSQANALLISRQPAYAATAGAIAPSDEPSGALRLVAQFATNTPDAPIVTATPFVTSDAPPTPFIAPTIFAPPDAVVERIAGTAVPTRVPLIPRNYELINIMLLGSDDEISTDGTLRTDTMLIVSINTEAKTVSVLSLPRDLFVYAPTPTMTRLNTVYGIGEAFGWQGGGWGLLRETVFYNFGINVHYFAKVNFSGFETIIDRLGGVEIAVDCVYQDYYPKAVIDPTLPVEQNYELRTLPVGYYRFNGFDALWYARTRRLADDFDRGRRQQQVLRAIFRAALNQGLITSVPQLWDEITQVVTTNIPFDVMLGLLPIALEVNPDDIQNYTLIRTYHTTPWQPTEGPFAGQFVQLPVYEPIRQLLTEFYQPPTRNRVSLEQSRIVIYNASGNPDWDRVAAYKLREVGITALPAGAVDVQERTSIIDHVADEKGSPLPVMLRALNLNSQAVVVQPDPNREVDYRVILGADYRSCTSNVLTPDQVGGG
jgi:LCP family protein required for cell wall assembly